MPGDISYVLKILVEQSDPIRLVDFVFSLKTGQKSKTVQDHQVFRNFITSIQYTILFCGASLVRGRR